MTSYSDLERRYDGPIPEAELAAIRYGRNPVQSIKSKIVMWQRTRAHLQHHLDAFALTDRDIALYAQQIADIDQHLGHLAEDLAELEAPALAAE